ncbi:hypothetical protein F5050DRAFT_1808022 [Lentinula boryana]|uniref:Uncharacterized protein n=1 Tax=Lentinula boryana TaxID=40481 RepID=A0ABQ8QC96_9AGAR|nr:hypothetical protein F5050DRAFT_1808022 [Lentinula boryana]
MSNSKTYRTRAKARNATHNIQENDARATLSTEHEVTQDTTRNVPLDPLSGSSRATRSLQPPVAHPHGQDADQAGDLLDEEEDVPDDDTKFKEYFEAVDAAKLESEIYPTLVALLNSFSNKGKKGNNIIFYTQDPFPDSSKARKDKLTAKANRRIYWGLLPNIVEGKLEGGKMIIEEIGKDVKVIPPKQECGQSQMGGNQTIVESGLLDLKDEEHQLIFAKMIKHLHALPLEGLGIVPNLDAKFMKDPKSLDYGFNLPQYTAADGPPSNRIFEHPQGSLFTFPYKDGKTRTVHLKRVLFCSHGIIGRGTIVIWVKCACVGCGSHCDWAGKNIVLKLSFPGETRVSEQTFMDRCREMAIGEHEWVFDHLPSIYWLFNIPFR